jgi:uncharacterized protein (DUF362 family)
MSNITRGKFLNLSFLTLAGIILTNLVACMNKMNPLNTIKSTTTDTTNYASTKESANSREEQLQNETTSASKAEKKAVIGIAGGKDKVSVLVGKAIELAGGLGFIKKGSTVLIKPNVNTGDPHPASANPEVVYEVINLVKKQDPYRVIVGDRSGYWLDTLDCMKKNKIYDAAVSAGAEVYPFDDEEWIKVNPKNANNWPDGFRIPKIINDADYIISVPVLKTHFIADFSIAIKNWVGILYPKDRTAGLHPFGSNKTVF